MVVGGVDVVVHVVGLRVLAEHRVVVRRAGVGHVAQRPRLDARQEQPGPDQPVARHGVLAEQPLLEAGREDVGDRLVERPGLALVDQPGGVLGDRVGELVAEHVDRLGEPVEGLAVAVAEDQLLRRSRTRCRSRAGSAPSRPPWRRRRRRSRGRRPRRTSPATRRRRRPPRRPPRSPSARVARRAHQLARQRRAVAGGVHHPRRPRRPPQVDTVRSLQPDAVVVGQHLLHPRGLLGPAECDLAQQVGRDEAVLGHQLGTRSAGSRRWRPVPSARAVIRTSDLPCLLHGRAVVVPVGMLAGDAAEVLDQAVLGLLAGHVEDLGGAVDLHPRVVPLVGEDEHAGARVAAQVGGLGAVGVRRDDDPAVGVDAAGHRRELRAPVGRRVTRTRWWRVRTKSSSSSRSTRVFVAIWGMPPA